MLVLVLHLALAQTAVAPQDPPPPFPSPSTPGNVERPDLVPPPESPVEEPNPEAPRPLTQSPAVFDRWTRIWITSGASILAGFAGLGIATLLGQTNPVFDVTIPNAALGAILIAGVAFSVGHALGGRGEVIFGFLAAAAVMAAALAISEKLAPGSNLVPLYTTLLGVLPATAATMVVLEVGHDDRRIQLAMAPNGFALVF